MRVLFGVLEVIEVLGELKRATGGDLTVRLTDHPLSAGVINTDTALFVEYYTYQAPGEPKFVLSPGDAGFDIFLGEAEALWKNGVEREV